MKKLLLKKILLENGREVKTAPPKTKPAVTPKRRATPSPHQVPRTRPKAVADKIAKRFLDLIKKNENLEESDYTDIFDKETLDILNKAVKARTSGKSLENTINKFYKNFNKIQEIESGLESELSELAVEIVEEVYPYVKDPNIEIDAKIGPAEVQSPPSDPNIDSTEEIVEDPEEVLKDIEDDIKKRRLINALTQGGAVAARTAHYLRKDLLDTIDPTLADKYKEFMEGGLDIYAFMAELFSASPQTISDESMEEQARGSSEVYYDYTREKWIIKARAVVFPLLLHELVKGIYELISLFAFLDMELDKSEKITQATDKFSYEIEDTTYGELIYKNLRDILYEIDPDITPLEREYIFQDIYRLPSRDFVELITAVIKKNLSKEQKEDLRYIILGVRDDLKDDAANRALGEFD